MNAVDRVYVVDDAGKRHRNPVIAGSIRGLRWEARFDGGECEMSFTGVAPELAVVTAIAVLHSEGIDALIRSVRHRNGRSNFLLDLRGPVPRHLFPRPVRI